ncbi:MAG TPA: hypothetical protein VNU97_19565 [Rhizomicrobium sp.]|jgi:hypothetical protein|nr:hypothetical protein [Rhizomicrobium sp.]
MPKPSLFTIMHMLAARMPNDRGTISDLGDIVWDLIRANLDTFLLDLMWENQEPATELTVVKTSEGEAHNFKAIEVNYPGRKRPAEPSLIRWVYEHDKPVWIVDKDGISPKKDYTNSWSHGKGTEIIPSKTIMRYVEHKPMRTEICYPLRVARRGGGLRAAGVLNIELEDVFHPSDVAIRYIENASAILNYLQCLLHGIDMSHAYTEIALNELRALAPAFELEPGPIPTAFISRPMSHTDSERLTGMIERALRKRGVRYLKGPKAGNIGAGIIEQIRASHFGVVVSTGYLPNVIMEWGALAGAGKPVIEFHGRHEGEPAPPAVVPPNDLRCPLGPKLLYKEIEAFIFSALDHYSQRGRPLHGLLSDGLR